MSDIKITSGNMLTGLGLSKESVDQDKINNLFNKTESVPEDKPQSKKRKPVKDITSKNLRHLESQDIKEDWEQVKPARKASEAGAFDSKSIGASRSGAQNDYGGKAPVSKALNSIFDPDRQKSVARKGGKMGEQIKSDAQAKRDEIKAQHAKTNDWEKVESAKTTKNLRPGQMGFTPNRSEIRETNISKVEIPQIKFIQEKNQASAEAGKKAADIKSRLDNVFKVRYEKEANDKRSWEEVQADKIAKNQVRKMDFKEENIKLSPDKIRMNIKQKSEKKSEENNPINDLFKTQDFEEKNIKRKSDLKENRKRREDDRSWEKVSTPKKTW